MSGSIISAELVAAYQATEYRVAAREGGFVLKIGQRSVEVARLLSRTGHTEAIFITAENPYSQPVSLAENRSNQIRLREDLLAIGATVLDGEGQGQDPAWPAEASFLAIGSTRAQGSRLGSKYRQNAIVWIDQESIPTLLLLR